MSITKLRSFPWIHLNWHRSLNSNIKMDPDRVGTIAEWSVPKYQPDIQSSLALQNFIGALSMATSLSFYSLLIFLGYSRNSRGPRKPKKPLENSKLCSLPPPNLKHFDPDLPTTLYADAFGGGKSGIICQPQNGILHPVAFWSRKCLPAEFV